MEAAASTIRAAETQGDRARMRRTIFFYDDGIVLCATVRAFESLGILEGSLRERVPLSELHPDITERGFGYMRAGLRSLAGQGWLSFEPSLEPENTFLEWTTEGLAAAEHRHRYAELGDFLALFSSNAPDAWSQPWDPGRVELFLRLLDGRFRDRSGSGDPAEGGIVDHLDAALVVPAMLWLRGSRRLGDRRPQLPRDELGEGIGGLLTSLGWLDEDGSWTELGGRAREYAVHFGIVGSYLPLLARLPELYRGEVAVSVRADEGAPEWHVNRELNVIASAAAHRRYFADADEIFVELFDREPVSEQPRFVADMGCGDGSWLNHLHELISSSTLRGRHLRTDPLLLVGIDCNEAALDRARTNLAQRGVPALLVFGDVGDPEALGRGLAEHGLAMEDGLHVRSFLDHDRAYLGAGAGITVPGTSSAAYVDSRGRPLGGAEVERDLVTHLRRWAPYLRKHGLVALEAHSVAPTVTRRHLGALHSVAFDAYHSYSHQYPVEYSAFISCCREAGLERVTYCERQYPTSRPFTAVSLNRFLVRDSEALLPGVDEDARREHTWSPDPGTDLEDGRRLHELLFAGGALAHPRLWCAPATGFVVARTLAAIEERLARTGAGEVIRVLDYGAGTGLATIELLKACKERGVEERLRRRGASIELHLADLPSAWFAQGFELLGDCSWTRFHSLRAADGTFRPLQEVLEGRPVDAVMANMVFHLIPVSALGRVASELADVLLPAGRLLWSSPDLGPPGQHAVLFHDPNRALRSLWLEKLTTEGGDEATLDGVRADRRILPDANPAAEVDAALSAKLAGHVERPTYEMLEEEIAEVLLVPSNGAEYLPEISDRTTREKLIRELMQGEVLPAMRSGPAGTALGLNVQWTLGDFTKPGS